jgi:dTDP-4-dehydrorhamnose reductase
MNRINKVLIVGRRSFIAQYLHDKLAKKFNTTFKNFREIKNHKKLKNFNFIINCSSYKIFKKNRENQDRDIYLAKKIKSSKCTLIMLSTSKVYGNKTPVVKKESSYCCPTMPYGKSRFYVEKKIQKIIPGQCLILRLGNLINFDFRKKTKSNTAINKMITDLHLKNIITIPTKKTIKDFITMKLFSSIIISCINKNLLGTYNVSSGFGTDLYVLSKLLIKGYGNGTIKRKKIYTDNFILDNTKLFNKTKKSISRENLHNQVIKIGKMLKTNV